MASWQLSLALFLAVVFVLVQESDCQRGNRDGDDDTAAVVHGTPPSHGQRIYGRGGYHRFARLRVRQFSRLFSRANNDFSIQLYRKMAADHANFVLSPVSIYTTLSMLVPGALGATKSELLNALNPRVHIHPAYSARHRILPHRNNVNATLRKTNVLFAKRRVELSRSFRLLRSAHRFRGTRLPSQNPEQTVNRWVSGKTMGKIPDLLQEGSIDNDTIILLANTGYFKGLWKEAFDPDSTAIRRFNVPTESGDPRRVQVAMMQTSGQFAFRHSSHLNAKVVEIPFKDGRFSMYFIIPDSDLHQVEEALNGTTFNQEIHNLNPPAQTVVALPKFTMDTDVSLQPILEELGITRMFSSHANFSRMTTSANVRVSKVQHRAHIELDEEGTTAAAATSAIIAFRSVPAQNFHTFDRPFMFVVRDKQAGVNLFMGRYVDPEDADL